jgi:hypothetical protein
MTSPSASSLAPGSAAAAVAHAVPADQPSRVHELADQLLAAYEVVGGQVHLAGCTLEEVPVVRAASRIAGDAPYDVICLPQEGHFRQVDAPLSAVLGLANLRQIEPPETVSPAVIEGLVAEARRAVAAEFAGPATPGEQLPDQKDAAGRTDVTLIWCKYVRGKVQFTIGDAVGEQTFEGWARGLQPPPFRCTVTGVDGMRVAATSDERIVAAEAIDLCAISGQRLPRNEMIRCHVTDQWVAADFAVRCPVAKKHVLRSELACCSVCQQWLSPRALSADRCTVCRNLRSVRFDDPRLLQMFARYPQLANWNRLRCGESEAVFVLLATRRLQRRLLVVDKDSGLFRHAAHGRRFSRHWTPLDEDGFIAAL